MEITLSELKEKKACPAALEAFERAVGERTAEVEWTPAPPQGWVLASPVWRRRAGVGLGEKYFADVVNEWDQPERGQPE